VELTGTAIPVVLSRKAISWVLLRELKPVAGIAGAPEQEEVRNMTVARTNARDGIAVFIAWRRRRRKTMTGLVV